MSVELTIQKLLEESRKIKQLDEANEVVPAHSGDEPSNKKNMKVDQKEAEGGTSKKANRATQGAVAPESTSKLESEEQSEEEAISEYVSEAEDKTITAQIHKSDPGSEHIGTVGQKHIYRSGESGSDEHIYHIHDAKTGKKVTRAVYHEGTPKPLSHFKDLPPAVAKIIHKDHTSNIDEAVDMSADVAALFNGEEGLTEEFRQKAETIFEAAVTSRIKEEVARITEALEAQYEAKLEEEIEKTVEGLVEHVDGYLNLMVEQWMENNEVALESGMKSDILESFVGGLKSLFEQHYIEVPEEKFDLVGEMETEIETLKAKLDEAFATNVELNKALNESTRESIVAEACEGLSDIEAEKLQTLAEEISFEDSESFAQKMQTIRENYFVKKAAKVETPSILAEETIQEEKSVPAEMQAYVKTISTLVR